MKKIFAIMLGCFPMGLFSAFLLYGISNSTAIELAGIE